MVAIGIPLVQHFWNAAEAGAAFYEVMDDLAENTKNAQEQLELLLSGLARRIARRIITDSMVMSRPISRSGSRKLRRRVYAMDTGASTFFCAVRVGR